MPSGGSEESKTARPRPEREETIDRDELVGGLEEEEEIPVRGYRRPSGDDEEYEDDEEGPEELEIGRPREFGDEDDDEF